jgi:predicted RNA polymerase sigma factor
VGSPRHQRGCRACSGVVARAALRQVRSDGLYELLRRAWTSPVVELNHAIALGFAVGPQQGLDRLDELAADPRLARYPYLAAARADCLLRLGRPAEARIAYDEALILTDNEVERDFLASRSRALDGER